MAILWIFVAVSDANADIAKKAGLALDDAKSYFN